MVEMTVESVRINLQTSQRVVILKARIVLDVAGRHVEVDSRTSDAIALAVRAKTPIVVEESVLERAGVALEASEETLSGKSMPKRDEEPDNLDAYRDFINTLDVLDEFGKE